MIPAKIEDVFIQLTTDLSGIILNIDAGKFAKKEFQLQESIYNTCSFLEGTLEAITLNEPFLIESMVIVSGLVEYNSDLEIFKSDKNISILIHNRTNVYKYVDQLNQNRNDIFFIKREIAEKNKELDRLRKIADNANEEKSRFLAMMSHEIRNPLNAILGYTEMISTEEINSKVKEYVSFLTSAGKNLKVIADDILDLSRIEAGKLQLAKEPFNLEETLKNCANNFKYAQKDNLVQFNTTISKTLPKSLLGDDVRITQILSNLISNSFKFTKKGSISLQAELNSEKDNNAIIEFRVTDTGRGMSEDQIAKIFEEYQQNELNDNRVHGGAGLGLAIVNRLIEAMNGKISVDSKINFGTTFSIKIPFEKIDKIKQVSKEQEFTKMLEGKKILVADDDVLNQTITSYVLNKEKAILTIVNDGLEALSEIKTASFDIILLDINMPNMTGEELIQQKKAFIKFNSATPFLALTGNTAKEDVERYLKLGFSDVILKPYTALELFTSIQKSLNI